VYFEANTVLGRCIAELSVLIQIEKKYPQVTVPAPWQFYLDHLNNTIYKAQSITDGVNLLPYRVSASVPSLCHIILGANQNAMPQVFRELSFLSGIKKRSLHIEDTDASEVFFQLHQFSSAQQAAFFCAEETFTGFALPYNSLGPLDAPQSLMAALSDERSAGDFHPSYYQAEMRFLDAVFDNAAEPAGLDEPPRFFALQKDGFDAFAQRHEDARHPDAPATRLFSDGTDGIKARIAARYMKDGRLVVSASALLPYYRCALFWLFGNVYQIEDIDAETTLMSPFARGNIYHDVMKRVFTRIKEQHLPLGLTETGTVPPQFQAILAESTEAAFAALTESRESALTTELLLPQREAVGEKCRLLLEKMLKKFASCTVAEVEPEPEWEMAEPDFTLAGIPDLLLYDSEADNYIIVDFKSGKPPSKSDCTATDGDGIKHFQLPVYHKLAESKGFTPTEAGFFTGIKEATIDQRFYPPSEDEKKPSFAAIEADFAAKTRRYVSEVLSVDFEKSCNEKYGECLRCDYRRVCRTTFSVQRETRMGRKTGGAKGRGVQYLLPDSVENLRKNGYIVQYNRSKQG
jgi:hypothetical protein